MTRVYLCPDSSPFSLQVFSPNARQDIYSTRKGVSKHSYTFIRIDTSTAGYRYSFPSYRRCKRPQHQHNMLNTAPGTMGNAKRKWRWSSKGLLGSKAPSKVIILDHVPLHMHDGAGDQFALDMSLDGCETEDGNPRTGVAAKMRRNGSRLLSIVGWQRSSGQCVLSSLLTTC